MQVQIHGLSSERLATWWKAERPEAVLWAVNVCLRLKKKNNEKVINKHKCSMPRLLAQMELSII